MIAANIPVAINSIPLSVALAGLTQACSAHDEARRQLADARTRQRRKSAEKTKEGKADYESRARAMVASMPDGEWLTATVIGNAYGRGISRTAAYLMLLAEEKAGRVERKGSRAHTVWKKK